MKHSTPNMQPTSRRAFSLVELLVAVGIVALLITITLTAGNALLRGRRADVTQNLLTTLDRALEEYLIVNNNNIPAYSLSEYENVPGKTIFDNAMDPGSMELTDPLAFPMYNNRQYPRFPDASVFIRRAQGVGAVDSVIASIPVSYLTVTAIQPGTSEYDTQRDAETTPSVLDSWARGSWPGAGFPAAEQQYIYYVHPDNDFAQAMFGRCVNRRPYFMSAGPDEAYGHGFEFDP
ncbi:MAG: type II secretion system protein, partial [Planctomycetota bacterium]|nr:type II secretion system protein [Planctomycetota bacterium]